MDTHMTDKPDKPEYAVIKKQSSALWPLIYVEGIIAVPLIAAIFNLGMDKVITAVIFMIFIATIGILLSVFWHNPELARSTTQIIHLTKEQAGEIFNTTNKIRWK
jgi:hypothetical protein